MIEFKELPVDEPQKQRPKPKPMPEEDEPDTTKTEKKKEPGVLNKFAAYIKKNQAAEAERRKRTGEKSLSEEMSGFGSGWGKNLSKGMAEVGKDFEYGLKGKIHQDDDFTDEILFGKKRAVPQQPYHEPSPQPQRTGGRVSSGRSTYAPPEDTDAEFVGRLCEFLRYVAEDDDVSLYQYRGKQLTPVDHQYLSKLLTRYLGYKIAVKARDLSLD